MRIVVAFVVLAAIALGAGVISSPDRAGAAFHLMRVYAVGGGAFADPDVQWVELRLADPFQTLVLNHHLCFYDAAGAPQARFTFTSNVINGADEASILVGSAEFDAAWAAGSPDFTFAAANTVDLDGAGPATADHPMASPSGKVAFGTDPQLTPSLMCKDFAGGGTFSLVDSVAYGTGYTGGVDFPPGTAFASDLPTAGTSVIRLQVSPICHPTSFSSPCPFDPLSRDNSVDYALVDANTAANNPRNNSSQSGPLTSADSDGDGVVDASDNCPSWPNPAQNLPPWSVPVDDADCDSFTATIEGFVGTDPDDPCANSAASNDEADDRWPADTNDNQFINTFDVVPYIPALNSVAPGPPYTTRLDLNASGSINTFDVVPFIQLLNKPCAP